MNKPLRSLFLLAVLGLFASSVWCAAPIQATDGKCDPNNEEDEVTKCDSIKDELSCEYSELISMGDVRG
jgi:hypothetical protein